MACPCFEPRRPLEWRAWPGRYRPPLGRPYGGVCRADPAEACPPDHGTLVLGCNLGYARDRCSRVPLNTPDAVRFAVGSGGAVLWALEKTHAPVDHGSATRGGSTGRGRLLDAQVEAYFRACEEDGDLTCPDALEGN